MVQPSFDAGVFITMLIIGFVCVAFSSKIGALLLVVSVLAFLVCGLLIVTGYDVSSYSYSVVPGVGTINQTSYFIGNGTFPIQGVGQLWMGYSFIVLALVVGIIFLDQTIKGNLIKG